MAITFDSIAGQVPGILSNLEGDIQQVLNKPADQQESTDFIQLQQMTTEWSLAANTVSTVIKTLGDALRGTLQKIN